MVIALFYGKSSFSAVQRMYPFLQIKPSSQDGKLRSYCAVVNCFLAAYATGDVIANLNIGIMNFKAPTGQGSFEYVQALSMKALRFLSVSDEYHLKKTFLERLENSISQGDDCYCTKHKWALLQKLACPALPLANLQ